MDIIPVNASQRDETARKVIEDPTFKGGLIITPEQIFELAQEFVGKADAILLKETLLQTALGLFVPKTFFLFSQINEAIKKLYEAGIIQKWFEIFLDQRQRFVEKGPQVLTMDHLMIGFQMWLAFLLLASALFVLEKIIFWCLTFIRKRR